MPAAITTAAQPAPYVPPYLAGVKLPPRLLAALRCPDCRAARARLGPYFACAHGWHGRLLAWDALWDVVQPLLTKALRELFHRRKQTRDNPRLILRRLLAIAAVQIAARP